VSYVDSFFTDSENTSSSGLAYLNIIEVYRNPVIVNKT